MSGLRAILVAMSFAAASFLAACEGDQPKRPSEAPSTADEFFAALAFGIQRDGRVFHAAVEMTVVEDGVERGWGTTEGWVRPGAEEARAHWIKGPDNTADVAERTAHIYTPDGVYSANLGGDDDVSFRLPSDSEFCLPQAPRPVLALVACGFLDFGGPDFDLSVESSDFEGRETVALVGRYAISSPIGSEQYPRGGPTPHPLLSSAKTGEYRLHLDAATYLPVASVSSIDSDPDRKVFGAVSTFSVDFLEPSSLPGDWFDPASIGYVAPDEEERRILEDPKLATPVYWLGRSFEPGNGLPPLRDLRVNGYGPGRARAGDEPNIQIGLGYSGAGGFVRLDHYPPGDWEAFKARLGGNFPWTWCAASREFAVGSARVTILAGYESFPYRLEGGVVVQSGEKPPAPPAPGPPPLKTEPCPSTPHDRFMAEVRFPDATIVINGTLSYGGQDGRPFGAYDTAEALEAVARGLRLRHTGE